MVQYWGVPILFDKHRHHFRKISLRQYLIIVIVGIILLVTGVLLTISYLQAEEVVLKLDNYFQEYTELNVKERINQVNSGLDLYDNTMNGQIKQAFDPFLDAYNKTGGNLSKLSLFDIQSDMFIDTSGPVDLYVINKKGVVVMSTVPEVLGLNLSQNSDYASKLPVILNGTSFASDRVVRSYSSASAQYLTGTLRKFAFMPTPDHQYLLEIGVTDASFNSHRGNLSYENISQEMNNINPYLDQIRIFDLHKNQFIPGDILPPYDLDPLTIQRLNTTITTRSDQTYLDSNTNNKTRYLFINLTNPDSITDMSVIAEITYSDTLLAEEMSRLISFFSMIGTVTLFFGVVATLGASLLITRPISNIIEDVDTISHGDIDHPIRSVDVREFIQLEQSISLMIRQIRTATEEIERRKTELSIASDIQQSFLPELTPDIQGFAIDARSIPAKEVGGDFYDIISYHIGESAQSRYGVLIADVSGKGVPAALFMALSRTILRVTTRQDLPLPYAISLANDFIYADAKTGMFVSLFYSVVNEGSDRVSFVNCGHNPPVVYHAADQMAKSIEEGGIVLGVDDSVTFTEKSIDLLPGDILVLYTDGVTEAINTIEQMYGLDRLCAVIRDQAERTPGEIIEAVLSDLQTFTKDMEQFDDITLVIIKRV